MLIKKLRATGIIIKMLGIVMYRRKTLKKRKENEIRKHRKVKNQK